MPTKELTPRSRNLHRQEEAFKGINIDREYCDKLTGSKADRPQLSKLRLEAEAGDNIYVESSSRLGCNVDDLRQIVQEFTDKNVTVQYKKHEKHPGAKRHIN